MALIYAGSVMLLAYLGLLVNGSAGIAVALRLIFRLIIVVKLSRVCLAVITMQTFTIA